MEEKFECELPQHHSTSDEIREILEKYRVIELTNIINMGDQHRKGIGH